MEVTSGCWKECGSVSNKRKGFQSGWQHEDWHGGKGNFQGTVQLGCQGLGARQKVSSKEAGEASRGQRMVSSLFLVKMVGFYSVAEEKLHMVCNQDWLHRVAGQSLLATRTRWT